MLTVGISNFIKNQICKNGKTDLKSISLFEIAKYAQQKLNEKKFVKGYRDGVIKIISYDNEFYKNFKCSIVKIDEETKLVCKVKKRASAEDGYVQIRALKGDTLNIIGVELILYRNDVLKETNEHSTNDDWELIAFHAIPEGIDNLPMKPATMMRNQLELKGGTKAQYSSDQWAESVRFWNQYAFLNDD